MAGDKDKPSNEGYTGGSQDGTPFSDKRAGYTPTTAGSGKPPKPASGGAGSSKPK